MGPGRPRGAAASGEGTGPTTGPARHRFPRASRIRRGSEIRSLLGGGKRRRTPNLDVFYAPSPFSHPRLGVIVPRYGRSAVDRNRVKRRLREIGRVDVLPALRDRECAADVLVRVRREAYRASYQVLREELMEVTESLCSAPLSSG